MVSLGFFLTWNGLSARSQTDTMSPRAADNKPRADDLQFRYEWLLYSRQIAEAQHAWERGDVAEAWRQLNSCRGDLRGWEHDYLFTLFTKNQRILKTEGHLASVAYSPDGRRIAAANGNAVTIYDVTTGVAVLRMEPKVQTTSYITSVAFSPDGKRIVAGTGWQTLHIWNAVSGESILTLEGVAYAGHIWSVAFSPDGKQVASTGSDTAIRIWNASSGRQEFALNSIPLISLLTNTRDSSGGVVFSPDGKRIAAAGGDKTITVWDTPSRRKVFTLKGHEGLVNSVCFSSDGKRIVSGSDDKTVRIWDASLGRELLVLKGHTDAVCGVAFDAVGQANRQRRRGSKDSRLGCGNRPATRSPQGAFQSRHECELQSGWEADRQRKRGPDSEDLGRIRQTCADHS